MTRTMLALLAIAALAAPAAAADRNYSVTDFDRVVVDGPYVVQLVVGRPSSAVASGSRDALDRVTIDVQSRTLRIRRNRQRLGRHARAPMPARSRSLLATRDLRSVRLIGPAMRRCRRRARPQRRIRRRGQRPAARDRRRRRHVSLGLLGSGRLEIAGTARDPARRRSRAPATSRRAACSAQNATLTTTTIGTVALDVERPVDGQRQRARHRHHHRPPGLHRRAAPAQRARSAAAARRRWPDQRQHRQLAGQVRRQLRTCRRRRRPVRRRVGRVEIAPALVSALGQCAHRHQLGIEPDDRPPVRRRGCRSRGWSGGRRSGA